nr:protein rogdi homolog isoform X7 [Caretta caretta]
MYLGLLEEISFEQISSPPFPVPKQGRSALQDEVIPCCSWNKSQCKKKTITHPGSGEEEFKWLLQEEVHGVLRQLQDILKEASHRFALPVGSTEGPVKQENFMLGTSSADQVKGVLMLQGDALCQADINLKMPRNNQLLHFTFREDKQWKLQQIQDARNHVNQAIYLLTNRDVNYQFKTGSEVLKLMDAVMLQLTRARNRLTTPASLTLPEIASSGLTKMFTPALPSDILVNFYINLNKLCLTVYQLHALQPNSTKNFRPTGGSILHNPGAMFCYFLLPGTNVTVCYSLFLSPSALDSGYAIPEPCSTRLLPAC